MFKLERIPETPFFNHLPVKDLLVSIQASENHYCSPKLTLDDYHCYSEFEVALIKDDEFFHPLKSGEHSNTTWAKCWNPEDDVAAYMPKDEIENMLADLEQS